MSEQNKPKWLDDIDFAAALVPFGDLDIRITRHRSKTSKVTYSKDYKLAPNDNQQAISDLGKFINSFIKGDFNGKVQFALDFKSGTIKLIVIKNKEEKHYGRSN